MPRSTKDSDDDIELKIGRKTRMLFTQAVDSPLRRSSRLKQSTKSNKYSPESESDGSTISNSQPTRFTRQRTATMDSTVADIVRRGNVRKISVSSDISDVMDIDVIGTPKKTARRNTTVSTPTRTSSRVASKRFTRAGSETKSPPPMVKTRKTRAKSVDPEVTSDQNKSLPSTPIKMRRRASILPSQSPVMEEAEEKFTGIHKEINFALIEVDEPTNSGKSNSTPDKAVHSQTQQDNKIRKSMDRKKIEDDYNSNEAISLHSPQSDATYQQYQDKDDSVNETAMNKSTEEQSNDVQNQQSNDNITEEVCDRMFQKHKKEDKSNTTESDGNQTEIETPLVRKSSPTKQLVVKLENCLNVALGEQKRSSSNKENQIMNIISSEVNNPGPLITTVTSLSKTITSVFANKSLNEKESKSPKNELNISKRRQSKESIENTTNYVASTEIVDNVEESMDTSTNSLNSSVTFKKQNLERSSKNLSKKQSLVCDINNTSSGADDTNKSDLLKNEDAESVDKNILHEKISDETVKESMTETINDKLNEFNMDVSQQATLNEVLCDVSYSPVNQSKGKISGSEESSTLAVAYDEKTEVNIKLKEQNASQDEGKNSESFNKSIQAAHIDSDNLETSTRVNTSSRNDESVAMDVSQSDNNKARDNLSDSTEHTANDSSNCVKKSRAELLLHDATSQASGEGDTEIRSTLSKEEESPNKIKTMPKKRAQDDSKSTKSINDDSDSSDIDINSLFQDIPTPEWTEKRAEETNIKGSPFDFQSVQNESEAECDLILVDKQAWLAAENIKAASAQHSSDYDSDDTVLLKSQLDAIQARNYMKKLSNINELQDDTENEEIAEEPVKRKSLTNRKSILKKNRDSSTVYVEGTEDSSSNDKSPEFNKALNRSSNLSASRLNISEQMSKSYPTETNVKMNQEIVVFNEDLEVSKKNTSLRESTEKRKSLNKSLKQSPFKQSDLSAQNNSLNKSRTDVSEESDNADTHAKENLKKRKRSLNQSERHSKDADNDIIEFNSKIDSSSADSSKKNKRASLIRSIDEKVKSTNTETSNADDSDKMNENDESDHKEQIARRKSSEFKTSNVNYSTVPAEINSDNWIYNVTFDGNTKCSKSSFILEKCVSTCEDDCDDENDDDNDNDNNSIDSDVKKEYNLDGLEQKISDDILGDECRASESEYSDSNDNGSDLADFVVADDEVEDETEEEVEKDSDEDEGSKEEDKEGDEDSKESEVNVLAEEVAEENAEDENNEQVKNTRRKNKTIYLEDDTDDEIYIIARADKNDIINYSGELSETHRSKKKISTEHTVPCQSNKKKDVTVKKSNMRKIEKTILLDTSDSTPLSKKERNSDVQCTSKDLTEQVSVELNQSKKKRASLDCSTPKSNSFKQHPVINVTPVSTNITEDILNVTNNSTQHSSSKKKKSKKNSSKENISLKELQNESDKEKISLSGVSSLLGQVGNTRRTFEAAKLNKSMSDTHINTPTLKHLMKEKLNESAPTMKLKINICKAEKKQLREEEDNIIRKANDESDKVSNLATLVNNNNTEKSGRREKKKRKKQIKESSNENIISKDELLNTLVESNVSEKEKRKNKKKRDKVIQVLPTENVSEETYQIKKKKKRKFDVIDEKNKDSSENNIPHRDIDPDKVKLHASQDEAEHSKKKKKTKTCLEPNNALSSENVTKKKKRQKTTETKDALVKETKQKKKKNNEKDKEEEEKAVSSSQVKVFKSKSKSNLVKKTEFEKSQLKNISNVAESKNIVFMKARNEALKAIRCTTERINQEMKRKKKQENAERKRIQEQNTKIPTKIQKNKHDEKKILSVPVLGLKRLPEDVLEHLSNVPIPVKKRRNNERITPSRSTNNIKFKESKIQKKSNFIPLSFSGSTTQFSVVNLQKAKKKELSKITASAAAYKKRMLNRNTREDISSCLKYLQKQSVSKNAFPTNMF